MFCKACVCIARQVEHRRGSAWRQSKRSDPENRYAGTVVVEGRQCMVVAWAAQVVAGSHRSSGGSRHMPW